MQSYSGLLLDLFVVPLLLWERTRLLAYITAVVFHLLNSVLFKIDVFPWFMILATLIFFPADWPRKFLRLTKPELPKDLPAGSGSRLLTQRVTAGIVTVFVVWQLVFPFRHIAYPGNASWTEEGHQFAWRMMLRRKEVFIRFYSTDGPKQRTVEVPITMLLNPRQIMDVAISPEQIVAIAPFFAERARRFGLGGVEIRVLVITSLNSRKPQLMIDPDLDILTVKRRLGHQTWIVPLTEPLRAEPCTLPVDIWPEVLGIELPVPPPQPKAKAQPRAQDDHRHP